MSANRDQTSERRRAKKIICFRSRDGQALADIYDEAIRKSPSVAVFAVLVRGARTRVSVVNIYIELTTRAPH
jgi:hypothetical protein